MFLLHFFFAICGIFGLVPFWRNATLVLSICNEPLCQEGVCFTEFVQMKVRARDAVRVEVRGGAYAVNGFTNL